MRRIREVLDWTKRTILFTTLSSVGLDFFNNAYITTERSLNPQDRHGISEDDEAAELIFAWPFETINLRMGGEVFSLRRVCRYKANFIKSSPGTGEAIAIAAEPCLDRIKADEGRAFPLTRPP